MDRQRLAVEYLLREAYEDLERLRALGAAERRAKHWPARPLGALEESGTDELPGCNTRRFQGDIPA